MSDFFLRSKHWLLFIPIALPTILSYVFQGIYGAELQEWSAEMQVNGPDMDFTPPNLHDYSVYLYGYILVMLLSGLTQLGWLWTMGNDLHDRVADGFNLKPKTFQITIAISGLFLLLTAFSLHQTFNWIADSLPGWVENGGPDDEDPMALIKTAFTYFAGFMLFGLITFGCQIYNVIYVGKTLKSIELGRPAKGGEFAGYAILSYLLIIGIWIMQPKVNRLIETGQMEEPREGVW
ncbi:hypothetical protein [Neolewinella persica]|uniref:hypothetical protein n=1 Tax=Neolewinella persica TaxID=70998 RepID=UPI000378FD5B|nr:hypothetical protein [Neolewinella persica]